MHESFSSRVIHFTKMDDKQLTAVLLHLTTKHHLKPVQEEKTLMTVQKTSNVNLSELNFLMIVKSFELIWKSSSHILIILAKRSLLEEKNCLDVKNKSELKHILIVLRDKGGMHVNRVLYIRCCRHSGMLNKSKGSEQPFLVCT